MILTTSLVYLASFLGLEAFKGDYIVCPLADEEIYEIFGIPTEPLNLEIVLLFNDSALLKWEEPDDDGGYDITAYQIEFKMVVENYWRTGIQISAEAKHFDNEEPVFVAIQNGLITDPTTPPYEFRVLAINENGHGYASASVFVEPPSPPLNLYVKDMNKHDNYIVLEWDPPLYDGGKEILFYVVEYKASFQDVWNLSNIVFGNDTTAKIENFNFEVSTDPYLKYFFAFRAQAWNIAGLSSFSNMAYIKTPPTPTKVQILLLDEDFVALQWQSIDPDSEDGSSSKVATIYAINYRERGAEDWSKIIVEDVLKDGTTISANISIPIKNKKMEFSITSITAAGKSKPSQPVFIEKADAPLNLKIKNMQEYYIDLAWKEPEYTGGSNITDYIIEYRNRDISGLWKTFNNEMNLLNTSVRLQYPGEGQEKNYEYRVRAVTIAGKSEPSNIAFIDRPSPPRNVTIKDIQFREGTVTLEWRHPEFDGGANITEYIVECLNTVSKEEEWKIPKRVGNLPLNGLTAVLEDLNTMDYTYEFRVAAVNMAGRGKYSNTTLLAKPNEPTNFSIVLINDDHRYAILKWQKPTFDGGIPITGYAIDRQIITQNWTREDVHVQNMSKNFICAKIRNLQEGKSYAFRAVARNMAGYGAPSLSDSIAKPSAPRNLEILSMDLRRGSVTLEWLKPEQDGGRSITGYVLEYRKKRLSTDWVKEERNSTGQRIREVIYGINMKKGDVYQFRVRAVNAAGRGNYSDEVSVDKPSPPLNLQIIGIRDKEGVAVLRWEPPKSDGGKPIKKYVISYREKNKLDWIFGRSVPGDLLEVELKGLNVSGTNYEFQVSAGNIAGMGQNSSIAFIDKPLPPQNLRVVDLDLEHGAADLTWQKPEVKDDGKIIEYKIWYRIRGNNSTWVEGDGINGDFEEGTQPGLNLIEFVYEFVVISINIVGKSEPSKMAYVDKPSTPGNLNITDMIYDDAEFGSVYLSWQKADFPGGGDKKGYVIEFKDITERNWDPKIVRIKGEDVLNATVSGLNLRDITHVFRIKAYNMAGFGNFSTEVYVDKPLPPRNLKIVNMYEDSAELDWIKPINEGQKPVIDYTVEYREKNSQAWKTGVIVEEQTALQTGLDLETLSYEFAVKARNMAGYSKSSNIAYIEKPPRPARVEIRKMDAINGSALLAWHRPNNPSRESPILGYIVEYKDVSDENEPWMKQKIEKNAITAIISGLNLTDVTYVFRVKAFNLAGPGNASEEIVAYKPKPPRNLMIVNMSEIDNCVTLKWLPPENEELYKITYYNIEYSLLFQENDTWTDAEKYVKETETKLCTHTLNITMFSYKFRVRAVNVAGISFPSGEDFVDKPDPPTKLDVANIHINKGIVELVWQTPDSDGGRNITSYLIEYRAKQKTMDWVTKTFVGDRNKAMLYGLNLNNYTYEFRARACNMAGKSICSNTASVDWPKPPDFFQVTRLYTENGTAELDWNIPEDDGGKDITAYQIEYRVRNTSDWVYKEVGSPTKASIHHLNLANHVYEFRIRAINMAGRGDASEVDWIDKPRAPTDLVVSVIMTISGITSVEIAWKNPVITDERASITSYRIEYLNKYSGDWESALTITGSKPYAILEKLNVGNSPYVVRVRPINMAGLGEPSDSITIKL